MPLYLTIMLALPFNRVGGGRDTPFHNISLPSRSPGDGNTQLFSVRSLPAVLEGQAVSHTSLRISLNLPVGLLYRTHVAAVVGPKLSNPAGYRYRLIKAVSRARNTIHRVLGNCAPPVPHDQKWPTTAPTRWFCHVCNHGPYTIAAQSSCTNVIRGRQCDHPKCNYCREE